jgi:hypothetical protein
MLTAAAIIGHSRALHGAIAAESCASANLPPMKVLLLPVIVLLAGCGGKDPAADATACVIHNGSGQYCLEKVPPVDPDLIASAAVECVESSGTRMAACPVENHIGRCEYPAAIAASRVHYYAQSGGLNTMTMERAQTECGRGKWIPDAAQ